MSTQRKDSSVTWVVQVGEDRNLSISLLLSYFSPLKGEFGFPQGSWKVNGESRKTKKGTQAYPTIRIDNQPGMTRINY